MSVTVSLKWENPGLMAAFESSDFNAALRRALRKAGSTGQRDMRSEASKRVRLRKAIRPSYVGRAFSLRANTSDVNNMSWTLDVSGEPVPVVAYPHRQTKTGVSIEVNRGKRTIVKGSFIATMRSGHKGVFKRVGTARLPIRELLGSRPIDALSHKEEIDAITERGGKSFMDTFERVLQMELDR